MNIIYKSSDINNDLLLDCLNLWNEEMGSVYPITIKSFIQNVINYDTKQCLLAFSNNKLVAFIIVKTISDELLSYDSDLFISLFYVARDFRKQGIGSKLLDFAKEKGKNIVIGKDINNFFPGVPTDFDNLTDVWLEKRGFEGTRYTHDLIAYHPITYPIKNQNLIWQICDEKHQSQLISFLIHNNWGRWAYEAKMYFSESNEQKKDCYLIALRNQKIVAFVRINSSQMNIVAYNVMWKQRFKNLGGIGPLGVDKEYRKQGLGQDIVSYAITELQKRGCQEMMIDWTGLMEFYRKFGFEVWKSYKYMKSIKKD